MSGTAGKIMGRSLAALAALLIVGFGILEVVIITGDRTERKEEPDAVVVLGAQVYSWGPSILLGDRLDTACDYLKDHPDIPVIVSGGQGPDEHATEASVMRDYLLAKGVDPGRIWVEEKSHNTNENLRYTRELLEARGIDPGAAHLTVVSNGFHLTRVRMLAERQGLNISTLAAPSTHFPSKVQSYIREAPALVKSWIFDR
ncbi:MAG: YdcF family protein [Clostridia bacterium]|nr:YdcF family protein [Clostridia bacterium]